MKTEAYYLSRYGKAEQAFELRKLQIDQAGSGELVIQVEAFGLNYADVMARNKLYKEAPALPGVLGYEVVGKVTQCGVGVNEGLLGKRVVAFTRFGGYSRMVCTKASACAEIDEMDANVALSLATQYVTAYYMSMYLNPIRANERVLIHAAAGGVGIALIQLAQYRKAKIIAKVSTQEKKDYLESLGVDKVIIYKKSDYIAESLLFLGNKRLDVAYNPVGGATFKKDLKLLGAGGRMVLFGGSELVGKKWGVFSSLNFVRKMGLIIPIGLMMRSKSVLGVNMLKIADHKPEVLAECLREVVALTKKGILSPPKGETFAHTELAAAHTKLESGKSIGKISIHWN